MGAGSVTSPEFVPYFAVVAPRTKYAAATQGAEATDDTDRTDNDSLTTDSLEELLSRATTSQTNLTLYEPRARNDVTPTDDHRGQPASDVAEHERGAREITPEASMLTEYTTIGRHNHLGETTGGYL